MFVLGDRSKVMRRGRGGQDAAKNSWVQRFDSPSSIS